MWNRRLRIGRCVRSCKNRIRCTVHTIRLCHHVIRWWSLHHTRSHAVEKNDEIIFLRPLHLCRHCGLVYGFERFQSIVCVITGNGPISRLASSVSLTEIHSERTPIYRIWYLEHFSPCDEWILRCFSVSISICGLHFCFKRSDRSKDIALVIALICCTLFSD